MKPKEHLTLSTEVPFDNEFHFGGLQGHFGLVVTIELSWQDPIFPPPKRPFQIKENKVRDHGEVVLVSNPNHWLDRDAIQCCREIFQ